MLLISKVNRELTLVCHGGSGSEVFVQVDSVRPHPPAPSPIGEGEKRNAVHKKQYQNIAMTMNTTPMKSAHYGAGVRLLTYVGAYCNTPLRKINA